MSDRAQKFCDLSLHSCNNSISFVFPGTWTCGLGLLWEWMVHEIFTCLACWWGTISYDYCIYQSKLLPQQFWNSVMICHYQVLCKHYDCLQVRHLWDQKVKAMLAFTIESVSSWFFLIHCIYTTHAIIVKLDVTTRNMCFRWWTLYLSHYVRHPTHTINICCQKENKLVVVPFTANDVFTIMEIIFAPGHFLISF